MKISAASKSLMICMGTPPVPRLPYWWFGPRDKAKLWKRKFI
jgi:hypothetical protein